MKDVVKSTKKGYSMYREFLQEFRFFCKKIKNINDFMIDHVINAAIDIPNEKVTKALDNLHNHPSTMSNINNGGRFTGSIYEYYAPLSAKDKYLNRSKKAIATIKKNLTYAYSYIPEENTELFCLSILEHVRSSGKITQDGLNYLYQMLATDRYSFVCNAYYFLVTLIEPLEWGLYWRAKDKTVEAKIINLPFIKNNNFIGREADIDAITENFKSVSVQCITGIIGCGKTQIAIEYAYRSSHLYSHIFWINSCSEASLVSEYRNIISSTFRNSIGKFNTPNRRDLPRIQDEFFDWFREHDRWLIIYDGFNGDFNINDYLPKGGNLGHILITSCCKNSILGAQDYVLDLIPIEESMAIVDPHIHEKSEEEKQKLRLFLYELGNLPMALGHVRDYLFFNPSESYDSYLALMKEKGTVLFDKFKSSSTSESTLRKSILIAYEKICEEYPNAAFLLNLCALLTDELPIELGIFESYAKQGKCLFPRELKTVFRDKLEFSELIRPLKMYSICTDVIYDTICHWSENQNTALIRIHRLTLSTIREFCDFEKYSPIVNDMIYRTIAISERSQAETIYNSMNRWKNEKSITLCFRDYSYSFFENVKASLPGKTDEQDLLKIMFNLSISPIVLSRKDVRQWLTTTGATLLANHNETTIGWIICNYLHYLGIATAQNTKDVIGERLLSITNLLATKLREIGIPTNYIKRIEEAIEMSVRLLTDDSPDDSADDSQEGLSKLLTWAKDNKNIRHLYSFLDQYFDYSEKIDSGLIGQTCYYEEVKIINRITNYEEPITWDEYFIELLEYRNESGDIVDACIIKMLTTIDNLIELINSHNKAIVPLPNHLLEQVESARRKSAFLKDVIKKYSASADIQEVIALRDAFITEYSAAYTSLVYVSLLASELYRLIVYMEYAFGLDDEQPESTD